MAGQENTCSYYLIDFGYLNCICFFIRQLKLQRTLTYAAMYIFFVSDIYGPELGQCEKVDVLFTKLRDVTNREINYMQDVMKLEGVVQAVMAATNN